MGPTEKIDINSKSRRVALLVVDPEGVLQLLLHGLYVGVLHQEGGAQLAELPKLDLSGPVLIDLMQQVGQLLLGGTEAHRPHDVTQVISRKELLLLGIEQVEADLQALDLIVGEPTLLVDLLEVDVGVGVRHGGLEAGGEWSGAGCS